MYHICLGITLGVGQLPFEASVLLGLTIQNYSTRTFKNKKTANSGPTQETGYNFPLKGRTEGKVAS